jgi:beta-glucosidase
MAYADTPAVNNFPGNPASVEYRESVYIGYRYYEKADKAVRYPFGFGLSYTTFEYSDIKLDKASMDENDTLTVTCKIKNTGNVAGYEIAQLYVADKESTIYRPVKELKGFKKIHLEPGETKTVEFVIEPDMLKFFDDAKHEWVLEKGVFTAYVGSASDDIRTQISFEIK